MTKLLTTFLFALLIAFPALAEEDATTTEHKDYTCRVVGDIMQQEDGTYNISLIEHYIKVDDSGKGEPCFESDVSELTGITFVNDAPAQLKSILEVEYKGDDEKWKFIVPLGRY